MMAGPASFDNTCDGIFRAVLREVLECGEEVTASQSKSVGSGTTSLDLRNHQFTIPNPYDRVVCAPERRFNVVGAIARFIWLVSGSDRLDEIEFYEPRARAFTDDGLTLPGSNYGARLFHAEPGLNQIHGVISRVKSDPCTRRAAAAVYQAEDAVRDSKDIPCAFGLFYTVREGKLVTTTVMRSNAAWRLLPFNIFEFTLLQELVAVVSGLKLGSYTHFAVSQHLFRADNPERDEVELAQRLLAGGTTYPRYVFSPMPAETTWETIRQLISVFAHVRTESSGLSNSTFLQSADEIAAQLPPYWADYGLALLAHALSNRGLLDAAEEVISRTQDPIRSLLRVRTTPASSTAIQPALDSDPYLLESRRSLLEYAQAEPLTLSQQETLWRDHVDRYQQELVSASHGERNRRLPPRVADWKRRYSERFDSKQLSLLTEG
jgi:thymidylate synthase